MKKYFYISIPIIVILVIAGWFFWFQYRPDGITSDCTLRAERETNNHYKSGQKVKIVTSSSDYSKEKEAYYEQSFRQCMRESGID